MISLAVLAAGWVVVLSPGDYAIFKFPPLSRHSHVLAEQALLSADDELKAILEGSYFRARYQLDNMVEFDYFGWLSNPQHIGKVLLIARAIQRDLYAYDYSWRPEEDLFGRLMAQLARRGQRKLLGQEWTV